MVTLVKLGHPDDRKAVAHLMRAIRTYRISRADANHLAQCRGYNLLSRLTLNRNKQEKT